MATGSTKQHPFILAGGLDCGSYCNPRECFNAVLSLFR